MSMLGKAVIKPSGIFVKLAGSDIETPATTTVEVEDGDTVLVSLENRKLVIIGNQTNIAGGATIEGIETSTDENGGTSVDLMGGGGGNETPIKVSVANGAFKVAKDSTIASFGDSRVEVFRQLVAHGGLVIEDGLFVSKNLDGNMVVRTNKPGGLEIEFDDDAGSVNIKGEVYVNGKKVLTEEEG